MDNQRLRDVGRQAAKRMRNDAIEDRVVSPIANKVGGCATIVFIILFSALGVGTALGVGRMGGNTDAVGPVAIGIGLLGGIVFGALVGVWVGRLLRRLLIRR